LRTKSGPGARKATPPKTKGAVAACAPSPPKPSVPKAKTKKPTVRIFVSYSHANAAQQAKLQVHLAQLKRDEVETWFDGDMEAGDALNTEISRRLREAHVFVALMSPQYIHSHWCQLEYRRAMGRRARGAMRVVVVVLRHCDWKDTGASALKVLPRGGRVVSNWRTADEAFYDVTEGIRGAVRAVRASLAEDAKARPARAARSKASTGNAKTAGARRMKGATGPKRTKDGRPTRSRVSG
jgi:hypothetical protein